jgi:hypothetical protein
MAQSLVQLGADLGQVETYGSLENGLQQALTRLNYRVVRSAGVNRSTPWP